MKLPATLLILIFILSTAPLNAVSSDSRRHVPLKQGVFLVAKPELMDPNFIHSVILLVNYSKSGALGIIINRPAGIDLKRALPDIEGLKDKELPLFIGGPVNQDNLCILHKSDKPEDKTQKVFENIYFTCVKESIISILRDDNKKNVRVYAGISSWAPSQLESEIKRRAWITIEADPESIFSDEPLGIWPLIFRIPEEILI